MSWTSTRDGGADDPRGQWEKQGENYRHNVRFPDPRKSQLHVELIGFVESLAGLGERLSSVELVEK